MDYTSIVNLALITVVYSTLIAPNIAKLSKIKEDILEIDFPEKVTTEGSPERIKSNGILLSKKFAQYSTKYGEIRNFLRYFYVIVAILVLYQAYRLLFITGFKLDDFILLLSSATLITILIVSVNAYMSKPSTIRSFRWLTKGGIAPIYLKHMYDPSLIINVPSRNAVPIPGEGPMVAVSSTVGFTGFSYVLTVESLNSRLLYYVSAGTAGRFLSPVTLVYENGRQAAETRVASLKLNEGKYRIRLLLAPGFFKGVQEVYETLYEVTIDANGQTKPDMMKILFGYGSENKDYKVVFKANTRVEKIELKHNDTSAHESIERLFSVERFQKMLESSQRVFTLSDPNGQLDRAEIEKRLSRRHVIMARLLRPISKKRRTRTNRL